MFSNFRRACVFRNVSPRTRLAPFVGSQLFDTPDPPLLRRIHFLADIPENQRTKTRLRFNPVSDTIDSSTAAVVAKRYEPPTDFRMNAKPLLLRSLQH